MGLDGGCFLQVGKVGKCKGWGGNPLYQGLLSVPGGFLALPFPHSPPWAFGVNHLSLAEVQNRPQLGRPGRSSRLQKVGHGWGEALSLAGVCHSEIYPEAPNTGSLPPSWLPGSP